MTVWPFKSILRLVETRAYLTDVFRTKSAEQRVALRQGPRISHALQHLFTSFQYAQAEQIIRGEQDFLVPDWTRPFFISVSAGSDQTIQLPDCYGTDFEQAILWRAHNNYEVIDVTQMSSEGQVVASISSDWVNARFIPLMQGINEDGLSASKITNRSISASIRFSLLQTVDYPQTDYAIYRNIDIMTDCPLVSGGLDESVAYPIEVVGGDTGLFFFLRDRHLPDFATTLRWRLTTLCDTQALRRWMDYRRGRWQAFWLSSRMRDLRLAAPIGVLDSTIEIEIVQLARLIFDIEILLLSGVVFRRRVTSWALDSTGVIILTINTPIPGPISLIAIDRISFLRRVRLDADRIEFSFTPSGTEVSVPCIESTNPP